VCVDVHYYCNTLLQHTTATHYCNIAIYTLLLSERNTLLQHTTATHYYCNTLLQHTTATHYCNTQDWFARDKALRDRRRVYTLTRKMQRSRVCCDVHATIDRAQHTTATHNCNTLLLQHNTLTKKMQRSRVCCDLHATLVWAQHTTATHNCNTLLLQHNYRQSACDRITQDCLAFSLFACISALSYNCNTQLQHTTNATHTTATHNILLFSMYKCAFLHALRIGLCKRDLYSAKETYILRFLACAALRIAKSLVQSSNILEDCLCKRDLYSAKETYI